jgi:hypothetical protein
MAGLDGRLLLAGVLLAAAGCAHVGRPAEGGLAAIDGPVRLDHAPRTSAELTLPLISWTERRSGGEPEAIHVLRVDLQDADLEVVTMIADDPDGDGPAEAALTDPRELAQRDHALAAVNANAFAGLPDAEGKRDERWRAGLPVDIRGMAVHRGVWRSGAHDDSVVHLGFGFDRGGTPFMGRVPDDSGQVAEAVNAWWYDLVDHGKAIPEPGGERHPRTAIGLDPSRRWLYLVVVDGRQPDYSVGMTARELAELMAQLGAHDALNLDGGGSSVLLIAGADAELDIVNRPSGGEPRPVPVLLGVRHRSVSR